MSVIRLRHTIRREGEQHVYFYDGELIAKDGVIEVPSDKPEWVRRAWVLGYRLNPETNDEFVYFTDVMAQSGESLVSVESAPEDSNVKKKGTRSRRRAVS